MKPKFYIINLQTHHVQYTNDPIEASEFRAPGYLIIDTEHGVYGIDGAACSATPVTGE